MYYLGDGEQTSGKAPEPMRVDAGLVNGGAVLGYGTAAGRPDEGETPDYASGRRRTDYIQDRSGGNGRDAVSRIDEDALQEIADAARRAVRAPCGRGCSGAR